MGFTRLPDILYKQISHNHTKNQEIAILVVFGAEIRLFANSEAGFYSMFNPPSLLWKWFF